LGSSGENKPTGRYQILDKAQLAAKQSVITLAAIGIAELIVTIFTGSITLTADGLDSLADAMISFIVWFGIVMIKKPRSSSFPFGYRKVEVLAAFTAAIIIIVLGSLIIYRAVGAFFNHVDVHYPELIRKVAIESNLISLKLDAKNSIKDGTSSFVGFISVFLSTYTNLKFMDAIGGMIIAGYIFFMAYTAIRESTLVLVDAVNNPQIQDNIRQLIFLRFKIKTRDVFLRPVGSEFNAEIHIILPNETRLDETSKIMKSIASTVKGELSLARVIVVPEPEQY